MTATLSPPVGAPAPAPTGLDGMLHRHRWLMGGVIATILAVALVWLASLPTGADSAAKTVPEGSRLAARDGLDDVEVLIISKSGALSVQVAYRGPKGWLGARLPAAPSTAVAAWVGTPGSGPIPALSAVYGRVPAAVAGDGLEVEVTWADGRSSRVTPASDGVFVAARESRVESSRVVVRDGTGAGVLEIKGP